MIDGDEYVLSPAYEALSTGLDEKRLPVELAVDLANAADQLTKDKRRLHERIEQGLEVPWGGPFAQLEMLITLTIDFAVAWGRRGEEQLLTSGDPRVEAVTALHARGVSTASEVLRMLRAGLPGVPPWRAGGRSSSRPPQPSISPPRTSASRGVICKRSGSSTPTICASARSCSEMS